MDSDGRKKFWNVLNSLHDNSETSVKALMDASPLPKTLCRFRSVSEDTLQQLNDNKLFFSSADRYDDPFDTYFYINVDQMIPIYEGMRKNLSIGDEKFIDALHQIAEFAGQNPNGFVNMLSNGSPDFTWLKGQLMMIRNSIQQKLFSICFCEDEYNETLWLKYASNYSGFVLVYDFERPDTFICGKEKECQNCNSAKERPYIYPVYYSDIKYDATKYATGILLMEKLAQQNNATLMPLYNYVYSTLIWEAERISLIKKKCHANDQEWRMIRPAISEQRSCIKMKPSKVIIGLRTQEYESRLIVSAAVNAGIQEIHKLYINDSDKLSSSPVSDNLYRI